MQHTKLKIVLWTVLSIVLVSCHSSADKSYKVSYIPCETDDFELGFLDKHGTFVKMNSAEDYLTAVINGYYTVDGNLYKYKKGFQRSSSPIVTDVDQVGTMNDGLIPICKDCQKIKVITKDGVTAFTLSEYCGQEVAGCYNFSDNKMRVKLNDGSIIFVDKNGRMLFDKKFSWATDFKKGHAIVQTEHQNSHVFSFVDDNATPLFIFEGDGDIVISHDLELICAKEGERIIMYNFEGKRVMECPKQVCGIQNFTADGFIFYNEDEEYGLMSYDGKVIIKAKYDQLVANGSKYLALLDDEIDLITSADRIIQRFVGDEIVDFSLLGLDFPNMIIDDDDHLTIIDNSGNVAVGDIEVEYLFNIEDQLYISNDYLPEEHIVDEVLGFVNKGKGLSNQYGAFFPKEGRHCHTRDITFLRRMYASSLTDIRRASKNIEEGINYKLTYNVVFDEPIFSDNSTLNTLAWLKRVEVDAACSSYAKCLKLQSLAAKKMNETGCRLLSDKDSRYIYRNVNDDLLYAFVISKSGQLYLDYCLRLIIMPYSDYSFRLLQSE